jgi:hypothetical protein
MAMEIIIATIPASASESPIVDLGGKELVAISVPSGWDTATIKILGSLDGISDQPLRPEITVSTVAENNYLVFGADVLAQLRGLRYVRIVSLSVPQGNACDISLVCRSSCVVSVTC